jgi:hypothetical protein
MDMDPKRPALRISNPRSQEEGFASPSHYARLRPPEEEQGRSFHHMGQGSLSHDERPRSLTTTMNRLEGLAKPSSLGARSSNPRSVSAREMRVCNFCAQPHHVEAHHGTLAKTAQ